MNNLNKQLEFWASENFGVLDESVTRDTVGIVYIFANLFSKCVRSISIAIWCYIVYFLFHPFPRKKLDFKNKYTKKKKIVKCVICAS